MSEDYKWKSDPHDRGDSRMTSDSPAEPINVPLGDHESDITQEKGGPTRGDILGDSGVQHNPTIGKHDFFKHFGADYK